MREKLLPAQDAAGRYDGEGDPASPATQHDDAYCCMFKRRVSPIRRAAMIIKDALHGRNMRHHTDDVAVGINSLLRSKWYHLLFAVLVLADLGLALLETPSTIVRNMHYYEPVVDRWVPVALELAFVALFALDVWIRIRYLGMSNVKRNKWVMVKAAFCVLATVNSLVWLAWPAAFRLHRIVRPIMIVAQFRNIQKIFGSMMRSIPRVLNVFVLLAFHVVFSTVIAYTFFAGYTLDGSVESGIEPNCTRHVSVEQSQLWCSPFSKNCTDYFGNFGSGMNQLFILLTTANYPDVMLPAYNCHAGASLFFIIYLLIGLYFIMNLLLAVAYDSYQDNAKQKVLETVGKRIESLDFAFTYVTATGQAKPPALEQLRSTAGTPLAGVGAQLPQVAEAEDEARMPPADGDTPLGGDSPAAPLLTPERAPTSPASELRRRAAGRSRAGSAGRPPVAAESRLSMAQWLALMRYLRPDLDSTVHELMFDALQNAAGEEAEEDGDPNDSLASVAQSTGSRALSELEGGGRRGASSAEAREERAARLQASRAAGLQRRHFRAVGQVLEVRLDRRAEDSAEHYGECCGWRETLLPSRSFWRSVVTTTTFNVVFDVLVYANAILDLVQFGLPGGPGSPGASNAYDNIEIVLDVLLALFVVELTVKIYGLGFRRFCSDGFNVFDLIVVPAAVIGEIVSVLLVQVNGQLAVTLSFLRVLRVLRALRAVRSFHVVLWTFTVIVPMFMRYLIMMVLVYYTFSILGMELFAYQATRHTMEECCQQSAYYENNYWDINFNSLPRSMVTLFALMVVNNWAITMEGYTEATMEAYGRFGMLFFYFWYFSIVIVCMNIVIAFLIEDFQVMQSQVQDELMGAIPEWKQRLLDAAARADVPGWKHWKLSRTAHPIHVYEVMFQSEIEAHMAIIDRADLGRHYRDHLAAVSTLPEHAMARLFEWKRALPTPGGSLPVAPKDFPLQARDQGSRPSPVQRAGSLQMEVGGPMPRRSSSGVWGLGAEPAEAVAGAAAASLAGRRRSHASNDGFI